MDKRINTREIFDLVMQLLVVGLLTRPAAAAIAIFTWNAIFQTSRAGGFFWSQGGSEYSILLFICALWVLVRGAGPYSLDRVIGKGPLDHDKCVAYWGGEEQDVCKDLK